MTFALNLRLCGLLMILLACLHGFFPRRFGWRDEMKSLSLLSRQMFYVHTGFVALTVFLNGLLFLFLAPDLLKPSEVNSAILAGAALFWLCRWLVQLFGYSSQLWRGKRFETRMHLAALTLWTYFTFISCIAFVRSLT